PDAVHVLGNGRGDDLVGGEPDPLVDDLEARVTSPHRDLLGAVRMSVQAGFADKESQTAPELVPRGLDRGAHSGELGSGLGNTHGAGDPGGRPELTEDLAQRARPLAGGRTGA